MSKTARGPGHSAIQAKVGERIQMVRELGKVERVPLAKAMGVDRTTIDKIERGTRAPSIFNVIELANRFDVSTDFLLRGYLDAKTDPRLAMKIAADHPEYAPETAYTDEDMGKVLGEGKHRPAKPEGPRLRRE